MSNFNNKSQFVSHVIFDASVRQTVLKQIEAIDRTHPVFKAITAFNRSAKDAAAKKSFRAVLNRHWSEDGRFIPLPSRSMDGVSARRVNVMDGLGMKPNTINATATAQASVRSPLTANKTVKGILPGSSQSSPLNTRPGVRQTSEKTFNPAQEKMKKIAQTSGQMRGLESALDRAIRHAMDFRWSGPRLSDAMSEQFGAQAATKIDPETAARIEEEVNRAALTSDVLQSVDPAHPDIAVLLAEAERILAALKELTQGHEAAQDSLEQSQIAAAQEDPAEVETAAGLSGGASNSQIRATAANAHKDRPEAAFSSGLEGPPGGRHAWGHAGQEQSQAFVDYMNGKDQQTEHQETDTQRIERTRQAYERMNGQA
ncbi:TPA: hypothetical protein U2T46_002994 [Burkholderia cenocepacia]|nr:hypothetical protein [Burkholderia cenocepacia]